MASQTSGRRSRICLGLMVALLVTGMLGCLVVVEGAEDGDKAEPHLTMGQKGLGGSSSSFADRQYKGACPYAIVDEEEALARGDDSSIPGTTINITNLASGRLGNHFSIVSRFLGLGYCCKAKLVSFPPKDSVLAPGIFNEGVAGPRHFDFSDAPSIPGFDSSSCADDWTTGGDNAYYAIFRSGRFPVGQWQKESLTACVESVRLVECEALFYFPQDLDICSSSVSSSTAVVNPPTGPVLSLSKAGNLVIHVRSGDIFRAGKGRNYGQPPLSFYTAVLNSQQWENVDIVTSARNKKELDPVVSVLQMLTDTGSWPLSKITITTDGDISVDLRKMLCADSLAVSRSTLGYLTMYHTTANTVFIPAMCNSTGSAFSLTPARLFAARSWRDVGFKVFGLGMKPDALPYDVYGPMQSFDDPHRLEMLEYEGVAGIEDCAPAFLKAIEKNSARPAAP